MKLAAVWFSCPRDLPLLTVSTSSVAYQWPEAERFVVTQTGDEREMLGFVEDRPRFIRAECPFGPHLGGSLDGCVATVLGLRRAADLSGADWLLKIDSDTLWLRKWAYYPHESLSHLCLMGTKSPGRVAGRFPYASGGAYFVNARALFDVFPRDTVEDVAHVLEHVNASIGYALSGPARWHEDMSITSSVIWRAQRDCLLAEPSEGGFGCHYFEPEVDDTGNPATPIEIEYDFLEFGRRGRRSFGSIAARRAWQRRHMIAHFHASFMARPVDTAAALA